MLSQKGAIANRFAFIIMAFLRNVRKKLKAGKYQIRRQSPQREILDILIAGGVIIHKLSIPEGLTIAVVQEILNRHPCLQGQKIQDLQEGSILPGTYFFGDGKTRGEMLAMMSAKLGSLLDSLMARHTLPVPLTKSEIVVLASIVEKETAREEERPLVACVFFNRLKIGMRLQADPTVIYGMTLGKCKMARPLTRKDWQFDSPFNTYLHKGLPPAPICCPGESSIRAVFCAAQSGALYFVASPAGGWHNFSGDLAAHNRNVRDRTSPNRCNVRGGTR
jgi:UPF0755 protein